MSGGILGGLLGGAIGGDNYQGTGILGSMNNTLRDNSAMLLGLGGGLLSGQGWGGATQGAMQGMQRDQITRQLKMKEAEAQAKKAQAQQLVEQYKLPPAFAGDPDAVFAMVQNLELKKRTPKELSFQEQLYQSLPDDQKAVARQSLLGLNKDQVKWEIKTIKNADGSETPVYFNPLNPAQTMAVPGYGSGSPKAQAQQAQREQAANIVVQDIDRALEKVGQSNVTVGGYDTGINTATGRTGQALSVIGGTNAHDVSALTDTIKANATFDKLQQMRASSPTGAALGAVSDTENKLLGSAIGSLEQSQSREQFEQNLKRVKKIYNEIIHGPGTTDEEGNLRGAKQAVQGGTDRSALEAEARRRGLIR